MQRKTTGSSRRFHNPVPEKSNYGVDQFNAPIKIVKTEGSDPKPGKPK